MNFELAMQTVCTNCGKTASNHRMTYKMNLYCLELNETGVALSETVGENLQDITGHISVQYLYEGGFSEAVAREIQKGLSAYVPERNT